MKRRQVLCYNEDGSSSDNCDINEKPLEVSECNTELCPDWVMGEWTEVNRRSFKFKYLDCFLSVTCVPIMSAERHFFS